MNSGVTLCFAVLTFCTIISGGSTICRADGPSTSIEVPLKYRRIYVPASAPTLWPRGEEKYLPIEANEFNSLVDVASRGSGTGAAAGIDAAEYWGQLDKEGRLKGHGRWDVVTVSGEPVLITIPPPSIVVTNLRWKGSDEASVKFGKWGNTGGAPDTWGLLIPASGSVEFDWYAQCRQQNDVLETPWRVPRATSNRITLDLPNGQQPTIAGAVTLASEQTAPSKTSGKSMHRWELAVPASADAILQITSPASSKGESNEKPSLQETVSYQLQQRGLNIASSWELDFHGVPQKELTLPLPNGVELTSVTADGHAASWHVDHAGTESAAKAIITMPAADESCVHRIELTAWQTLAVDIPWQLPRLHPDSVFWSAGHLNLEIWPDLELRKVRATDCTQQSVKESKDGDSGTQRLSFAAHSADAAVEVRIARHQADASVRMCSSLALADPDVTGKLVTEWNVAQSSLYKLSGELSPGWNIEAVETIPSDALAEWFVDRSEKRRVLEIQLTHPVRAGHGVTVIINGRLQRTTLTEPLTADSLRVARWSNARVLQHLVAFQSAEPFVAETFGDLPKVPRDQIGASERALFDMNANENEVVDLTRASDDAGLKLDLRRAEYTAEVQLDASVANNELRQNWRISARPTSNAIDRLTVYATQPLGDNVRWVERFTNNPIIAERVPAGDPRRKDWPKNGEVWLLRLSQPTSKLVELGISTTRTLTNRASVALLSLPEAVEQHGTVSVRAPIGNSPLVESTALEPVPVSATDAKGTGADDEQAVRVAFRYSPRECLDVNRTSSLSIAPQAGNGTASIVVHRLKLESYIWPNGKAQHCATYDLVSDGATEFRPRLPSDATLSAIVVNHQLLDITQLAAAASSVPIFIPAAARDTKVQIYFETRYSALGASSALTAPGLMQDIPVLERDWSVWLPRGFVALSDTQDSLTWRQRLFGPLARTGASAPFNPLQFDESPLFPSGDFSSGGKALANTQPGYPAPVAAVTRDAPSSTLASVVTRDESLVEHIGWHKVHQSNLATDTLPSIIVMRPVLISSWEIAALFISFLVTLACGIRGRWLFTAIAFTACLALLLPEATAPLATGALWGLILAAVPNWNRVPKALYERSLSTVLQGGVAVLAIAFVTLMCGPVMADPDPAPPPRHLHDASEIERVLIPVDGDKRPVDSKYFVGQRFLQSLLERQAKQRAVEQSWLLRGASYVGELSNARDAAEIAVGRWSLAFSIETLARDTTVSLPLVKGEADWQATAMLDGVPAPLRWRDDGRQCSVEVAQPGRYTLTLFCTPETIDAGDRRKISLTIPQLASATIQLHTPEALSGVSVADAIMIPAAKDAPRMTIGELVQAHQIVLSWPRLKEANSGSQGLTATELKLVRVGADGVQLESKYILEGGSRRPESLTVRYDPRWKPDVSLQSAIGDQTDESVGSLQTLSIPIEAASGDRQEVRVRWTLEGAPSIGFIRLPSVFLSSPLATQRWLGLAVDPSLECALADSNTSNATANEFMTKWGKSPDAPAVSTVAADFDADHVWTISARPREAESAIHETLHVALGEHGCRIMYDANVTPANAERFGLRLRVPATIAIDEIRVAESDGAIPTRWVRDGDDYVTVFFDSAAQGDYHLTLSGTLPFGTGTSIPLPRVSATAATSPMQVQLYRDDDVEIKLQDFPAAVDSKGASIEPPPIQWLVRPVGAFRLDDDEIQHAHLMVNSVRATLGGDMFTSVSHEGGSWWVTVKLHLTSNGNLDVVRLRFPPSCLGPFDVESSLPESKEIAVSADGTQILGIRFNSSVMKNSVVDLGIRSPLSAPPGSAVVVPEISTVQSLAGRRYIGVPIGLKNDSLTWSEVGVKPATVPHELTHGISGSQVQYEIVKEPIQVESRPREVKERTPRIRLIDTLVALGRDGAQTVVSSFVIAPDGVAECQFELPSDHQLLFAELDGRAALATPSTSSQWRVVLSSTQLPQVLEVVSRVESKHLSEGTRELTRATLSAGGKPLPVEVSLWSISQASGGDSVAILGAAPVGAVDQAVLRFDRLLSIAESANAVAAEAPQPDGANWFRPWAARLRVVNQQASQLAEHQVPATSVAHVTRSSEEQLNQIQSRFEKWLEESTDLFGNADSISETLATELSRIKGDTRDRDTTYYASQGSGESLRIEAIERDSSWLRAKIAAAALVILAAGFWLSTLPVVRDFFHRAPFAVGVLFGIVYWAWLSPSWLGLLITAASASMALRFKWPGRFLRTEASTVLRSTRTT